MRTLASVLLFLRAVSLLALLAPSSVAVIGASRKEGSIGRAILTNLSNAGFAGPIYAVNPNASQIGKHACVPTIAALSKNVDLAVVTVPAPLVEDVISECARAHVRAAVIVTSGFAEIGEQGKRAQDRILAIARETGMRIVGPNCLGVIDTRSHLNASFAPTWPPAGNVAIASQSGALAIAMIDQAAARGLGIASLVSIGNRADVSSNDLIDYWADDDGVGVIALYLESFGNPRNFAEISKRASKKKPIVALKAGRSTVGMRAASSHSAALATSDVGVDALLAGSGVIRVSTMEELFDVVQLLSTQAPPRGNRVGVVSNAGGPGILLADACAAHDLVVPPLAQATRDELRALLPAAASVDNPVDLTASAPPKHFEHAIDIVGRDPDVDALVTLYIPPFVTRPCDIAAAVASGAGAVTKERPIAAVFMTPDRAPTQLCKGARGSIPAYAFPENVAAALAHAVRYERWRTRDEGVTADLPVSVRNAVSNIIDRQRDGWMPFEDVAGLLDVIGIPMPPFIQVKPDEAVAAATAIGFPVVAKVIAPGVVHKTELGGIATDLRSAAETRVAIEGMTARMRNHGIVLDRVLIQRQIDGGVEMLLGMTRDATLGPIVVTGVGGIAVELLRDVAFRLPPITDQDALRMLSELRAAKLLDGFRGAPIADRVAMARAIERIGALVELCPEFAELDINPVFVLAAGKGVVAVDARIRIARDWKNG